MDSILVKKEDANSRIERLKTKRSTTVTNILDHANSYLTSNIKWKQEKEGEKKEYEEVENGKEELENIESQLSEEGEKDEVDQTKKAEINNLLDKETEENKELEKKIKDVSNAHQKYNKKFQDLQQYNKEGKQAPSLMLLVRKIKSLGNSPAAPSTRKGIKVSYGKIMEKAVLEGWQETQTGIALTIGYNKAKSRTSSYEINKIGKVSNYYSFIRSGWDLLKNLVDAIKGIKDGIDKQEVFHQLRDMAENILNIFKSAMGIFANTFPGTSIIKSAIEIVYHIINLITNSYHLHKMRVRKEELWGKMREKKEKYIGEETSKGRGSSSEFYNLNTTSIKEQAKRSYGLSKKKAAERRRETGGVFTSESVTELKRRELQEKVIGLNKTEYGKIKGEGSDKTKAVQTEYDNASVNLAEKVRTAKEAYHNSQNPAEREKKREEKRLLKALQLMNEYQMTEEARKKMQHKVSQDVGGLVKAALAQTSAWLELVPGPQALAGVIMDATVSSADFGKKVVSKSYQAWKDSNGKGRSTRNKKIRRNRMAQDLYSRMEVISRYLKTDGMIEEDIVTDSNISDITNNFETVNMILNIGLDAYIGHILQAENKEEMLDSMSEAFSTAGN